MTLALMAVRQEVDNFESFVVVQELVFAMNLVLYGQKTAILDIELKSFSLSLNTATPHRKDYVQVDCILNTRSAILTPSNPLK